MTEKAAIAVFINGGSAGKDVFAAFASELTNRGLGVVTFDFPIDETPHLAGNSLLGRLHAAERVLASAAATADKVVIVGYSMGGHTAIELAAQSDADLLVLVSPAAYGDQVREIPFGPRFREVASRPASWESARVFDLLQSMRAPVILMLSASDDVVPAGILQRYREIVESREGDVLLEFSRSPHQLIPWLDRDPSQYALISELIMTALNQQQG